MNNNDSLKILGIARFIFYEGKIEEFKHLSKQCMDIVNQQDTGTLRYEIYLNDDETEAIVIEEYKDLPALMEHTANIGKKLSTAITATGKVQGEILGKIDPKFREQLKNSPVQPFSPM